MAIKGDLSVFRGEDVVLRFSIDEDITGWTLALIASDELADATPTLTVAATITDAAAGECEVALTAAQTGALALSSYHYELARTNTGAKTPLRRGSLIVQPRVGV